MVLTLIGRSHASSHERILLLRSESVVKLASCFISGGSRVLQLVVIQHQGGDTREMAHLRRKGTKLVTMEIYTREENHVHREVELGNILQYEGTRLYSYIIVLLYIHLPPLLSPPRKEVSFCCQYVHLKLIP